MGWNFGSASCYPDDLGFPRLVSSWCNQKDGTCPRVVPRMIWNSLGESTDLCSPGHRRLNQCGVLSPSPGPDEQLGLAAPQLLLQLLGVKSMSWRVTHTSFHYCLIV